MKIDTIIMVTLLTAAFDSIAQSEYKFREATLPEEVVYSKSRDGFFNAGIVFHCKPEIAKPAAVILVHGWGVNFYSPSYIVIGRDLADKGYTCIAVNTRMHDLGNVEGYKNGKRVRGGGCWGIANDQTKDIAGWVDFAESKGFKKVVLFGHSAGCAAVRIYQAEKQDRRIMGLVFGSGSVDPASAIDPGLAAKAAQLVSNNKGDALVEDPKRSFPSYTSAATMMDIINTPPQYNDFFGVNSTNAGISKIQCPILAFYGTRGDIAGEKALELLKACVNKQTKGAVTVTTTMIKGAEHMYMGEEEQVSGAIANWIDDFSSKGK